MGFPLLEYIKQLSLVEITVLAVIMVGLLYIFLSQRTAVLMFLLVLSTALFNSTIPIASAISSIIRWLIIGLLILSGILFGRLRASIGVSFFWLYTFFGFASLLVANDLIWQLQKGGLLMAVALAIPFAYGDKDLKEFKSSLTMIALVTVIFALLNFSLLSSSLNISERFFGYGKSAPTFALVLGALLPFSFWGLWQADSKIIRLICGIGFLIGTVTLLFSAQRAGILAGFMGILPLSLSFAQEKKNFKWAFLLAVILLATGYYFLEHSSIDKLLFLQSRFSLESGFSNREAIWSFAIDRIKATPLIGRGIGAAETVFKSSFHNGYLEIWYNAGILGLFFFLCSQIYFLGRILLTSRTCRTAESKSILALALGYMAGFLLLNLFESTGAGASNLNLVLYLFLGVLVSNNRVFMERSLSANSQALVKHPTSKSYLIDGPVP